MKPDTIESTVNLDTTIGELAAAYYEAALQELGNEAAAARVSRQLTLAALGRSRKRA
jgi:hypothetical protein